MVRAHALPRKYDGSSIAIDASTLLSDLWLVETHLSSLAFSYRAQALLKAIWKLGDQGRELLLAVEFLEMGGAVLERFADEGEQDPLRLAALDSLEIGLGQQRR